MVEYYHTKTACEKKRQPKICVVSFQLFCPKGVCASCACFFCSQNATWLIVCLRYRGWLLYLPRRSILCSPLLLCFLVLRVAQWAIVCFQPCDFKHTHTYTHRLSKAGRGPEQLSRERGNMCMGWAQMVGLRGGGRGKGGPSGGMSEPQRSLSLSFSRFLSSPSLLLACCVGSYSRQMGV